MKTRFFITIVATLLFTKCITNKNTKSEKIISASKSEDIISEGKWELIRFCESTLKYVKSLDTINCNEKLKNRILLFSLYTDSKQKEKLVYSFFSEICSDFHFSAGLDTQIQNDMKLQHIHTTEYYDIESLKSIKDSSSLINIYCSKLSKGNFDNEINKLIKMIPDSQESKSFNFSFISYPSPLCVYANCILIRDSPLYKSRPKGNLQANKSIYRLLYEVYEGKSMPMPRIRSGLDELYHSWSRRFLTVYNEKKFHTYLDVLKTAPKVQSEMFNNDVLIQDKFSGTILSESEVRILSCYKRVF
jgi:hypothetical protein